MPVHLSRPSEGGRPRPSLLPLSLGAGLCALFVACAPAADETAQGDLSAAEIAALAARYPVLTDDPVPAPEPNSEMNGLSADAENLPERVLHAVSGTASFYADTFEGRRTASGIPFRQNQMVAAHRGFPFGTILRVTNEANDRNVRVRVVDRGPFSGGEQRVLDLSRRAANELGFVDAGTARVRIEVLEWGEGLGTRS